MPSRLFRVAELLLVILILALVYNWADQRSWKARLLMTLAVLLAVPELSYLGLGYAPSLIAICLVVSAHLLLRSLSASTVIPARRILLSLFLFGLGVSFRWNVLTYGLVIFADLASDPRFGPGLRDRIAPAALWGFLALLASLVMIGLSGYGLSTILAAFPRAAYVFNQAGTLAPGLASSLLDALQNTAITLTTLLTPALVLLAAVGLFRTIRKRSPLGWVISAGFAGALPWLGSGVPKFLIVCMPVLLLSFVLGMDSLWSYSRERFSKLVLPAIILLALLFPWLVGVRIDRPEIAWGPAFERKPFDYKEVEGTSLRLSLGPGLAFPTPEGPRALYGHAYVLFGGGWKRFILEDAAERTHAITSTLEDEIPLVVTSWSPDFFLDELYLKGFQTSDPHDRKTADGRFVERRFTDAQGRSLTMYFHEIESDSADDLIAVLSGSSLPPKIVLVGYPTTLHLAFLYHPESLQSLGARTALLDLLRFLGTPGAVGN